MQTARVFSRLYNGTQSTRNRHAAAPSAPAQMRSFARVFRALTQSRFGNRANGPRPEHLSAAIQPPIPHSQAPPPDRQPRGAPDRQCPGTGADDEKPTRTAGPNLLDGEFVLRCLLRGRALDNFA